MQQLIDQMVTEGLLDEPAARRVRAALAEGTALEEAVLLADGVSEERLLRFLAAAFGVPYIGKTLPPVFRPCATPAPRPAKS